MEMSVRDKINNGYYKNDLEYPSKPSKPKLNSDKPADIRSYADAMEKYAQEMEDYKIARDAYRSRDGEKHQEFRSDAIKEVGLEGVSNADAVYNYAWQEGHSSGHNEVMNHLEEISDLVLDAVAGKK